MESRTYYVYALKDPRAGYAGVFYIGKGQGHRKTDHLLQLDESPKSERIGQIQESGHKVILEELVTGLTEIEALRVEAELIGAFGTQATGGQLLNQIMPSGKARTRSNAGVIVPPGITEKASLARKLLEEAILTFVQANENGVRNIDVARHLDLRSAHGGRQRDYLSYSILGNLLAEGRVRQADGRYFSD
jgi:hypothetical protein